MSTQQPFFSDLPQSSKPTEELESPFLDEELFADMRVESEREWASRESSLAMESPFQSAFESGRDPIDEPEMEEPEALDEELYFESETGIIDGDNRIPIKKTDGVPWRWICKVSILDDKGRYHSGGTGVLISNRHVLTAAHVVYLEYVAPYNYSIEVTPAFNDGDTPFGQYSVSAKPKIPKNYNPDPKAKNNVDWDYALITLKERVGEKPFSKLGGKALCHWGHPRCGANTIFVRLEPRTLNGKAAITAGYPKQKGGKQLWCAAGILHSADWRRRTMWMTADTTEGQSGSPVWVRENDRYYLVGIAAGAGKNANAVVRVTTELINQVRAWVREDGETPTMAEAEELFESTEIELGEAEESLLGREESELMTTRRSLPAIPEEFGEEEPEDWDEEQESRYEFDPDLEGENDVDLGVTDAWAEEEENDYEDEIDFEHLGILEFQVGGKLPSPTLGFEFDLNFGFENKVTDAKGLLPPAGFNWPSEGLKATDHEWKDSTGNFTDAFVVTMDAVRLEIATVPFHIDSDFEFDAVVDNVKKFGQELINARKTYEQNLDVPGVGGHPTTFEHPRTVVNKPEVDAHGNVKFPGDRNHASYMLAPVPLVIHRLFNRYPTKTGLWSSPQATITLPLAEFGKLVWEIHKTKGGAPGEAFTGRNSDRLGLRDDLAWLALKRAVADRKKKLGTTLSDGTKVTDGDFTRSITSLVTILVMYMLTSIKRDDRDQRREQFAKGSLPLNVKTPFWQIHRFALTNREKFVFHELYTDPGKRENLFVLASGATSGNGSRKLFPDYTHWDAERFLGTSPTWDTLVDAVVKEKPVIVTAEDEDNRVPKKGHRKGDEILIAPLSSKIDWAKTEPRIAVEMRRLGFSPVGFSKWTGLMKRLRTLAIKVNP